MNEIDVKELDEQALFAQALDVMNRAVRAHEDQTPYKQILQASEKLVGDRAIAVGVAKEPGGEPYDFYTVRFADGSFELEGRGRQGDPSLSWRVSRSYLEGVVEHPQRYIEHPEKLDLDWLKGRLGIG
jgi:hypothetical protein